LRAAPRLAIPQLDAMKKNRYPSRAAKQLGDFGEGLVTYDFIRKGYEVALVDHVGADLIVTKNNQQFGVSVKTRWFKNGSKESRMYNIESKHLDNLNYFCSIFDLTPIFSLLICLSDENSLYLLSFKVSDIPRLFSETKVGFSMKFSEKHISELKRSDFISFSEWSNEQIGKNIFT